MLRDVRYRFLALAGSLALLAACGEPPAPPLTAPPEASASPGPGPSGPVIPLPSGYTGAVPLPTNGLPTATVPPLPYVPPPTLPPVVTTPPRTTTTTPPTTRTTPPSLPPARCTNGPTKAQVLAVLEGLPGIPDKELVVTEGPFCSGSWQFAAVRIAGETKTEQLFVVTTGTPTALKVIEAGTDVCSTEVQTKAPAAIRIRACGA